MLGNMIKIIGSFIDFFQSSKKTIILVLLVALLSITVTTTISVMLSRIENLTIPSLGNIKTIGVEAYWDPTCENKTEMIEWGTLWPGTVKTVTLYLRSISNVDSILDLNITDVTPIEISDGITLSWDYKGELVKPNQTIEITLFLHFSDDYKFINYLVAEQVKNFSFDVYIAAVG